MPNASGTNQFEGFPTVTPYGDKEKQGMLQRLAPLAGTPVPEVRRASQDEPRHASAAQEPQAPPAGPVDVPVASPPPAEMFAAIAAIPGASPLVQGIFGGV